MKIRDNYKEIQNKINTVKEHFGENSKIAKMFENSISNTLSTTIKTLEDGSVFVITGDIPAMWLRDSACQLKPFILFAKEEPEIKDIIVKLIEKQMDCIIIDPYANAFNEAANGNGFVNDKTKMNPYLWERKYEIDSLCYPVQLSYLLWKNTGCTEQFTEKWLAAVKSIYKVFKIEQDHENKSDYTFEREDCVYTDTLSREGKGALVNSNIGLIWSGFRPSDDACTYGYLIPSNMLASVTLEMLSVISDEIYLDVEFADKCRDFSKTVRDAIENYAILPGEEKEIYAYEVDGFGQYNIMDDANLPSLLSMPYIGYCSKDNVRYRNTREMVLSARNPYYYIGRHLKGIGSPHTPSEYAWHMSLCIQGITSDSREEKQEILNLLENSDADTHLMHESVNVNDPTKYTRPWFAWANSVYCEFVLDCCGYKVEFD